MANHMAEVAKMLGVELGERFNIINYTTNTFIEGCFYFTDTDIKIDGKDHCAGLDVLYCLLIGSFAIKRKPWKPSVDDSFWMVDQNGDILCHKWRKYTEQLILYKIGNSYCTGEEALNNRDKWVAFYASDEVLEV